jgi:hypothetical protein
LFSQPILLARLTDTVGITAPRKLIATRTQLLHQRESTSQPSTTERWYTLSDCATFIQPVHYCVLNIHCTVTFFFCLCTFYVDWCYEIPISFVLFSVICNWVVMYFVYLLMLHLLQFRLLGLCKIWCGEIISLPQNFVLRTGGCNV